MLGESANRLRNAVLLGITAAGASFFYLEHQARLPWGDVLQKKYGGPHAAFSAFLAEFWFMTLSVFICSFVGFFLSRRYKLPGAGEARDLPRLIPWFLVAGIIAAPLAYFLHDRIFITGAREMGWPQMLPAGAGWSFVFMAYDPLAKETVLRFGLLTLLAGLFRGNRHWWAVGGITAFAAGLSMRELSFAGHAPGYDLYTLSVFSWALILNAALGAVYVKKGLWASMSLRACVDLRFVVYALLSIYR